MKFLLTFFVLSIVNVIFSTIRSIATVKGGKWLASLLSGGYFAFYNVMLIYTVADFPMWQKCAITFLCNVIGVYVVKAAEERMQKERLWKIELTIPFPVKCNKNIFIDKVRMKFDQFGIQYNYIDIDKYLILNCYCYDKIQTHNVKLLAEEFGGKGFASEAKISI